jgi:hypothetical protein
LISFTAAKVVVRIEDGIRIVGFSDRDDGSGEYVLLQREVVAAQGERDSGDYHWEISSPERSGYGGLRRAALSRDQFVLDQEDASGRVTVKFQVRNEDWTQLRENLTEMFKGSDCAMTVQGEMGQS